MAPLCALILVVGVFPETLVGVTRAGVETLSALLVRL
jgi:hypothetical protein